jgi:hypothetical protein
MKTMLAMMVLFTSAVFAQDEAPELKELTNLRVKKDAMVKTAIAPILKDYVALLTEMKMKLGAKGDAAGAMAVQKELDSLKSASLSSATKKDSFIGEWTWANGVHMQMTADGKVKDKKTVIGTWECTDRDAGIYETTFTNNTSHELTLSKDGKTAEGKSIKGSAAMFIITRVMSRNN